MKIQHEFNSPTTQGAGHTANRLVLKKSPFFVIINWFCFQNMVDNDSQVTCFYFTSKSIELSLLNYSFVIFKAWVFCWKKSFVVTVVKIRYDSTDSHKKVRTIYYLKKVRLDPKSKSVNSVNMTKIPVMLVSVFVSLWFRLTCQWTRSQPCAPLNSKLLRINR